MFGDLMETLMSSTSLEGGALNYEVGPVADHVKAVYGAVLDLEAMSPVYDLNTAVREGVGAGWAVRANVVAEATGVEVVASAETEVNNEQPGVDQSIRESDDATKILERAKQLMQTTAPEISTDIVPTELETQLNTDNQGAEADDFTKDQERKAREIAAREALDKAYSEHQIAA